ncbi:hypothetical protein [Nocardioides convexus]|uniref:hypothetical protein n=1 Tax=Nocardioides convexus TaxID=2712224 RepID=UPI002418B2DE|nr:hypothetical protein [Nocardioides convexus]
MTDKGSPLAPVLVAAVNESHRQRRLREDLRQVGRGRDRHRQVRARPRAGVLRGRRT